MRLALSFDYVYFTGALQADEVYMDEKQLAKLVRQNAARAEKLAKARQSRKFDPTLPPPKDEDSDIEREQFFKEMKRREF